MRRDQLRGAHLHSGGALLWCTAARDGERAPGYDEEAMSAYMRNDEITITIDLKLGEGRFTAWGCDLTKRYVAINGDYRS